MDTLTMVYLIVYSFLAILIVLALLIRKADKVAYWLLKKTKHEVIIVEPDGVIKKYRVKYPREGVITINKHKYVLQPDRRIHIFVKGFSNEVDSVLVEQATSENKLDAALADGSAAIRFIPSSYFTTVYQNKVAREVLGTSTTFYRLIIMALFMNVGISIIILLKLFGYFG